MLHREIVCDCEDDDDGTEVISIVIADGEVVEVAWTVGIDKQAIPEICSRVALLAQDETRH